MTNWLIVWAAVTAAAAIAQATIAFLLWRIHRDEARKDQPVLKIHWNGFQNRPKDPHEEMLLFRITVVNEGRRPARMGNWGLEVRGAGGWEEKGLDFGSLEGLPLAGEEAFQAIVNREPWASEEDKTVAPFFYRRYLCWLPANGGWESWKEVRLHFTPIGGERAEQLLDWNLFWLRS